MSSIPLNALPADFPHQISTPKFQIGDRVRWQPQPTEDFGTVTGIQFAPAQHLQTWTWKYTVWLDLQSPSRLWLVSDTAWETDLEAIPASSSGQTTPEGQHL